MDDKKYMQLALAEARKAAELGEIPIGAVLADITTGEVIAAAHNDNSFTQRRRRKNLARCLGLPQQRPVAR